jgi:hypothetical protein
VLLGGAAPEVLGISGTQTLSKHSEGGGVVEVTTILDAEGDGDRIGSRFSASDSVGTCWPESEENRSDLRSGSAAYQSIESGQELTNHPSLRPLDLIGLSA